ncbi:MAG: hypothetical protein MUF20_08045, partial [Methylotetracoccus sp.]|nr:hypothetical protein [Methylotetracoccus sp.]
MHVAWARPLLAAAGMLVAAFAAHGQQQLDPACFKSFAVDPSRVVTVGNWAPRSTTCGALEEQRQAIFRDRLRALVDGPPSNLLNVLSRDVKNGEQEVAKLQQRIETSKKKVTEAEIKTILDAQMANAGVAAGIVSCVQTLGGGCGFAAFSSIYGVYSAVQTAGSISEQRSDLQRLSSELAKLNKNLAGKKALLPAGLDRAIRDFHELCYTVRDKCL